MGFFMNLFIASMVALVTSDNAFYFLVFFEMMSLASYFLVLTEQDDNAVNAGLLYFFIAHAGSVLIMIAFFIFYCYAGSFEFSAFRQTTFTATACLYRLYFGIFRFWRQSRDDSITQLVAKAHPAAPSHASAMMSGVMVKLVFSGSLKSVLIFSVLPMFGMALSYLVSVQYLPYSAYFMPWQNMTSKTLGLSHGRKYRYHYDGVGVGMIGIATHHPVLATVGLLGGLYPLT